MKDNEKYEIVKDKILNKWLVFEKHGNIHIEVDKNARSKTKKGCQEWIDKQTRKTRKKVECK